MTRALPEALKPTAERHDVMVAPVAIAWPGVTGAIVGARLELTPEDLSEIEQALLHTNAGKRATIPN